MKKERSNGVIRIESELKYKFKEQNSAMRSCQQIQWYYASAGYMTTSYLSLDTKTIEVTVHFEGKPFPSTPASQLYSTKVITSHSYWNKNEGKQVRVRCVTYYFKY